MFFYFKLRVYAWVVRGLFLPSTSTPRADAHHIATQLQGFSVAVSFPLNGFEQLYYASRTPVVNDDLKVSLRGLCSPHSDVNWFLECLMCALCVPCACLVG